MEEFITATFVAGLFFAVLRFFKIFWLKQHFPASFISIAGIFAWCTVLALLASFYSFISVVIDITATPTTDNLVGLIVTVIVLGIAGWLLYHRKEVLDFRHMVPFLRSAILFQPYDARGQELLERNERTQFAQSIEAAEVSLPAGEHQQFIDISENAAFKEDVEVKPSGMKKEDIAIEQLKKMETADLLELFTANTSKKSNPPLYQFITLIRISPSDKQLNLHLVLPLSVTGPDMTQEKVRKIEEHVHTLFQSLIAEPWLAPYLPFFDTLKVTSFRMRKDEFDMTRESAFLAVQIGVMRLRFSRGKPFNATNFEKEATVTALE